MILENGLIRTLDPQIPTQRALAIAGDRIAGGVGVHETALASPETVDLGGRVVVPGLNDAHVHFPTWALAQTQVDLDGCGSLDEALARIRGTAPGRSGWIRGRGWRGGETDDGSHSTGDRRHAGGDGREGRPLAVAQLRGARCSGDRVPAAVDGILREEAAWRLPGAPPARIRRRVRRRDARRAEARGGARRDGRPRQGRRARRARALAAARARRAHAARLAVGPARPGR